MVIIDNWSMTICVVLVSIELDWCRVDDRAEILVDKNKVKKKASLLRIAKPLI
jgi:hypothetical protein